MDYKCSIHGLLMMSQTCPQCRDELLAVLKRVYKTAWPHRVHRILADEDSELAEQFAEFMHDLHKAIGHIEQA